MRLAVATPPHAIILSPRPVHTRLKSLTRYFASIVCRRPAWRRKLVSHLQTSPRCFRSNTWPWLACHCRPHVNVRPSLRLRRTEVRQQPTFQTHDWKHNDLASGWRSLPAGHATNGSSKRVVAQDGIEYQHNYPRAHVASSITYPRASSFHTPSSVASQALSARSPNL
jgi:hypothetical protein